MGRAVRARDGSAERRGKVQHKQRLRLKRRERRASQGQIDVDFGHDGSAGTAGQVLDLELCYTRINEILRRAFSGGADG